MDTLFDYISKNSDWIFSGVGVTAFVVVGGYFIKSFRRTDKPVNPFAVGSSKAAPLVSLYSLIPRLILRLRFPESRFNSLLNMDVRPRGESIRLNLGELPDCQVWLQVINHSPFDIEIENIKGELNYNGCRISVETKQYLDIAKHSTNDVVLLEGTLTGEQANHCAKDSSASNTSLSVYSRIRTSFDAFNKYSGDLQSLNVSLRNAPKQKA